MMRTQMEEAFNARSTAPTANSVLNWIPYKNLLVSFFCVASGVALVGFAPSLGLAALYALMIGIATLFALVQTSRRDGEIWTPVTVFLAFCAIHAVLGYYTSETATAYLSNPGGGIYRAFDTAFLIVTGGILSTIAGYLVIGKRSTTTVFQRFLLYLEDCDVDVVKRRARIMTAGATVALLVIFIRLDEIPLFSDDPGRLRYVQFIRPEVAIWAWFQNRCFDILQAAVPFLLVRWLQFRHLTDVWLSLAGLAVAVFCVRRGLIVVIFVTAAFAYLRGKRLKLVLLLIPLLLLTYMTSQYFLLNLGMSHDSGEVLGLYGYALPEIRDLAYLNSSLGGRRLWGSTLAYALIPLPSFATEFQRQNNLRAVILEAIGVPLDAPHGGLRISLAGEAFVNFGYPGVVLICFAFGLFCGEVARGFHFINGRPKPDIPRFVLCAVWVLTSFCIYLAGTSAAGLVRFGLVALALLFVRAAPKGRTAP